MTPNRSASIVRFVYDDEYELCLNIGVLTKLSQARDCGPAVILNRLQEGAWFPEDLIYTLRFALEGGGMHAVQAKKFAEQAVQSGYLLDYQAIALECLFAAMVGAPDDMPETPDDEPGEPQTPTTESST